MVMGTTIEFHTQTRQCIVPTQMSSTPLERQITDKEVSKLLVKGVIIKAFPENGEFIYRQRKMVVTE